MGLRIESIIRCTGAFGNIFNSSQHPMSNTPQLSDLAITRSGWIKKRQNTSPRWIQIGVVVFAILNILLEGSVLLMEEMGNIEDRGLVLSAIGAGIIFFALFSIPVRRWWALVVNGVFFLYEVGVILGLVSY